MYLSALCLYISGCCTRKQWYVQTKKKKLKPFCMSRSAVQGILKKNFTYQVTGSLWIECEGERFFGPGRVELLQKIEETGSINKAARLMGMSYKKAWEMISMLNTQAASPLVITQTGGEKGGGSVITAEARQLIDYHRHLRRRFIDFLEKETAALNRI